jgi:hypothetical protein
MLARATAVFGRCAASSRCSDRAAAAFRLQPHNFSDDASSVAPGSSPSPKARRRFNFAPAIEVSPEARKALSLLAGMKKGAVGVRATYVPVGIEMRFSFEYLYNTEKQHRFDETILLDGACVAVTGTLTAAAAERYL